MPSPIAVDDVHLARFSHPHSPSARILHQVRALGTTDRGTLSESLGLSQPTVTRHVTTLLRAGLLREVPAARQEDRSGRPRLDLKVDGSGLACWGIHIGVNSSELLVVDGAGRPLARERVAISLREHAPREALEYLTRRLARLGAAHPRPAATGVAFSTGLSPGGLVSAPEYGWEGVCVAEVLGALLPGPVMLSSGVCALAGADLAHTPLGATPAAGGALYFYARDVLALAWVFEGHVQTPHSGRAPSFLRDCAVPELAESAPPGQHPLGTTALLGACRRRGHPVDRLDQVAPLAARDPAIASLLDARVSALTELISAAVDVVDPAAVVLAGDAFTVDRATARAISARLRADDRQLRVHLPGQPAAITAATQLAVHRVWADPLTEGLC